VAAEAILREVIANIGRETQADENRHAWRRRNRDQRQPAVYRCPNRGEFAAVALQLQHQPRDGQVQFLNLLAELHVRAAE
jgi:hypothetical protein